MKNKYSLNKRIIKIENEFYANGCKFPCKIIFFLNSFFSCKYVKPQAMSLKIIS